MRYAWSGRFGPGGPFDSVQEAIEDARRETRWQSGKIKRPIDNRITIHEVVPPRPGEHVDAIGARFVLDEINRYARDFVAGVYSSSDDGNVYRIPCDAFHLASEELARLLGEWARRFVTANDEAYSLGRVVGREMVSSE
jgi:hypothetical protein